MKYLFGDSVTCSVQYNFLAALETFVDAAAQAVHLDLEIARSQQKAEVAIAARDRALQVVEEFHNKTMDSLEKLATEYDDPNTNIYAKQVREHAEVVVEEARTNCRISKEKDEKDRGSELQRRRKDLTVFIERFLKTEIMPVTGFTLTMDLIDGRNQLTAVLGHPNDVMTTFTMSAGATLWQSPVQVSSLVQGVDLQVGSRKSWITGSRAKSSVSLDDFTVGSFELRDDSAVIHLRKRPEQPDVFTFKFARKNDEVSVEFERTDEDDGDVTLDADERRQLEKLWEVLRKAAAGALRERGHLLAVRVDGKDLFDQARVLPFLERVVQSIAPIVQQIVEHSPNPAELSMKVEDDEGRREEIYVRRQSLVTKLEALDEEGRAVFLPLALLPEPLTSDDVDIVV